MSILRRIQRFIPGLLTVPGLVLASPAQAEILQIGGRISAEVQEFIADQEGDFDSAFEEFGATAGALPIQVAAMLLPPVGDSPTDRIAQAFADFRDPAASSARNPGEIGLETTAYSREAETSFTSHAIATETRSIILSANELGVLLGEAERPVTSGVFVSGAVVIWSEDPARDLTGMSVDFAITVEQQPRDAEPLAVFNASLSVNGAPGGDVAVDSSGGLSVLVGGPELIRAAGGFTAEQLGQELAGLGRVHLVLVPEQELNYAYTASGGVEFDLQSTFEVRAVNIPDGTGIAGVFGRPFEVFARAVAETAGVQTKGAAVQAAVNAAMADAQVPHRTEPADAAALAASGGSPCGAIGLGALALTFALMLTAVCVRMPKGGTSKRCG